MMESLKFEAMGMVYPWPYIYIHAMQPAENSPSSTNNHYSQKTLYIPLLGEVVGMHHSIHKS